MHFNYHRWKRAVKNVYLVNKAFLRNTTFQGYHYLVDPNLHWSERIFWAMCLITVSGYGILLMYRSIKQYQENPINLSVNTLYLSWKSKLPALVICDRKRLTYEGIEMFIKDPPNDLDDFYLHVSDFVNFEGDIVAARTCTEPLDPPCALVNDNVTRLTSLRLKCPEIFAECYFNNVRFDCCERFRQIHTVFGKCFAINSIAADIPEAEVDTVSVNQDAIFSLYFQTTYIFGYIISSEETITYRETRSTKFDDMLEEHTLMDIYVKFKNMYNDPSVHNVSIPVRKCRFPEENPLKLSTVYSLPACVVDKLAELELETCGCLQYYLPINADKTKFCYNLKQMLCISNNLGRLLKQARHEDCLPTCTEAYIQIVGKTVTPEEEVRYSKDGNIKTAIKVHFIAPTVVYWRRVMRDTIDLVGGIGTLFFGASIISIVELFYFYLIYPCTEIVDEDEVKRLHTPDNAGSDVRKYYHFKKNILESLRYTRGRIIPYRN